MFRRYFLLPVIAALVWSASGPLVLAYDDDTTHPALTNEVVDFYNRLYPDRGLTAEQKEWIIQGSINEDEWPRWLNHFYDPVRKIGWTGEHQGIVSSGAAQLGAYAGLVPVGATVLPATEWVHNRAMQAGPYARQGGDRTWGQAIKYYVDGNLEEAYRTLGHTIHLLEDMTVPDHSRNDSHAPLAGDDGSPFEDYLTKWNRENIGTLNLVGVLSVQGARPPSFNKVEDYLVDAAEYSNKYFFSKDTINSSVYASPRITRNDGRFGYGVDENGKGFLLAKINNLKNEKSELVKFYSLLNIENHRPILDAYFSRLAPKAVLYGAGVIELFEKQAKEALEFKDIGPHVTRLDFSRVTSIFSFSPAAFGKKMVTGLASLPSLIGQGLSAVVENVKNAATNVATFTQNVISKLQNQPENVVEIIAESSEQIENLIAGDLTDGIVVDTEEERAQLRALKNQLDDISDQIDDLAYQVDVATGKEGRGGVQEKTDSMDGETDGTEHTDSADGADTVGAKNVKISSKKNVSSVSGSSGGGGGVAASAPNLSITEIMYNTSGTDDGREWIEVRNDGVSPASFDDVRFLEGDTNHRLTFAQGSASLAAGAYAVIADDSELFLVSYPTFSGTLFDSSFSLSNSGETLALSFNGSTFHSVSYSSSTGAYGDGNSLQLIGAAWVPSTPTPGATNVADASSGGSSSEDESSATSTATSSPPTSGFGSYHVLISEVQLSGVDAGDEFIELYNPTDATVDISTWSLQYVSGAVETVSSSSVSKKNFLATSSIAAKGFYLIGRGLNNAGEDGYRGSVIPDMTHRTFSLSGISTGARIFLVPSTTLIESETDPVILDVLNYTSTTVPDVGGSFERRAWSNNLCHSVIPGGSGEFLGNGCDTGVFADDFETRPVSNPQNSGSFIEPRAAPTALEPPVGASSLAEYNRDSVSINFTWEPSSDFQGSTSTIIYRITNASTSAAIYNATSTSFARPIAEVGRSYSYVLQAFDRDGMGSATSSVAIVVPSFLDALYFYRDPRASSTDYLVDMYYPQYPFIPDRYSSGDYWHMPVFYLNRAAPGSTSTHIYDPEPIAVELAEGIVAMKFRDCSGQLDEVNVRVRLPDAESNCISSGPTNNDVSFSLLEDPHLRLTFALSSDVLPLTESDYLTVAFYDYSTPFWAYGGGRMFSLVATDANRYYFSSSTPSFAAPELPDLLTPEFDETSSRIIVRWATSTDADTLDNLIAYEIAFSTSTVPDESEWQSAGVQPHADLDDQTFISHRYLRHVVPEDSFTIGVRALDEFGVTSTARTTTWQYSSVGIAFSQATSTGWSNAWGQKNSGHPQYPVRASLQSIVPTSTLTFDVAMVRVLQEGSGSPSTLRFGVFADDGANKPLLTGKIGETTVDQLGDIATSTNLAFTFSSPITLDAGTKYWFGLDVTASGWDGSVGLFSSSWKNVIANGDEYGMGESGIGAVEECTNNDYCGTTVPSPSAGADWYLKLYLRQ